MSDGALFQVLQQLAMLRRQPVDRLALTEAVKQAEQDASAPRRQLERASQLLGLTTPTWLAAPDAAQLPAVIFVEGLGWGLLVGQDPQQHWVARFWDPEQQALIETRQARFDGAQVATLSLAPTFKFGKSPVFSLIGHEIFGHKRLLAEAALGGAVIGLLGLVVSFYSLQVYDRVIPTGGMQTLLVLSLGALMAIGIEWLARRTRTHLYERLIDAVDQRLARAVYLRMLSVRLDQLPASVGSLAAQMRGYETVRAFLTQVTGSMLVDLPFLLLFLLVIAMIGGMLAVIPFVFFLMAVGAALLMRGPIEAAAREGTRAGNFKTGLLVETVEGAETIKSGQGGWRMLSRWLQTTTEAREAELDSRRISESFQHMMAAFQQFSYILLVAAGAWMVGRGELTMGGLIACTILAGRVLNPVALLAGQAMQWAHAKAALEGLDYLWRLEDDHHGHEPVVLDTLRGHYRLENVRMLYGNQPGLLVRKLEIRPGERVGIVGPVGAGKTSLLRLLSGMYKPGEGHVYLDDVDLAHLSKPVLAEHVGYLQQEGRLFAGTLRENLILGMIDPGDDAILAAARRTGLLQTVIAQHPKGLQQAIYEGGTGLSGGQRQLVNLTRVLLRQPKIWLLDEPTASVDGNTERQIIDLLASRLDTQTVLVLVTHKPEMLKLVDRLIVVANHQVLMDGPRDQVLASLQGAPASGQNTAPNNVAPLREVSA